MGTKRDKPEEIVAKLRQVEVLVGDDFAQTRRLQDDAPAISQHIAFEHR